MPNERPRSMDFSQLFNDSYERLMAKKSHQFFERFYDNFVGKSPEVAVVFAHTDMARQYDMLRMSLMQVMSFASDRRTSPYLEKIAARHAALNIKGALFALWSDSLIETVRELDEHYDAQVELAWRVTLAPGLEFMRCYGTLVD